MVWYAGGGLGSLGGAVPRQRGPRRRGGRREPRQMGEGPAPSREGGGRRDLEGFVGEVGKRLGDVVGKWCGGAVGEVG